MNLVMLCGWLLHYLYRGFITPFIMPYSSRTVALGIPLAGIVPNCIFGYLVATQVRGCGHVLGRTSGRVDTVHVLTEHMEKLAQRLCKCVCVLKGSVFTWE